MESKDIKNNKKLRSCFLHVHIIVMLLYVAFSKADESILTTFHLHDHYQQLCDRVINVWSVLDIMRSINIEPQARVNFIHALFHEIIAVLREIVVVDTGCEVCPEYSKQHKDELSYFFEMVTHVENAFEAVFTPRMVGEEQLLAYLMLKLREEVKTIQDRLND